MSSYSASHEKKPWMNSVWAATDAVMKLNVYIQYREYVSNPLA